MPVSSDGARYYVVAHEDPGVEGWVDTTGLPEGTFAMRFVYRENPAPPLLPSAEATLLQRDALRAILPADVRTVSPQQRRGEIAIRQSHIKRRWRGH